MRLFFSQKEDRCEVMSKRIPKIKMFLDTYVPVTTCNFRCHYCYITQQRLFSRNLPKFVYSPEVVAKAISKERLGGTCLFNICGGGETLLPPEMTDYIRIILEQGHYVMVITNGTVTKRFDEIVTYPSELLGRLFFKFSYHYLELKQKKIFNIFFENIRKVRDAGCSFTLELTPCDEIIPNIDEIRQIAKDRVGADCHVTIARDDASPLHDKPILTKLSRPEYEKTWGVFDSDMFKYKLAIFGEQRKEFCYAGAWSAYLNLGTGIMTQCYCNFATPQNIFENIERPIKKTPIGYKCSQPHCYNGHAFLTLGVIPEHEAITYARIRNKVTDDESEWLTPLMKGFLSNKLSDTNEQFTPIQKFLHSMRYSFPARLPYVVLSKIKKLLV